MDNSYSLRIIIFLLITGIFIILYSRHMSNLRVHGFYRFFVFEALLAVFFINVPCWFKNPLSLQQIVSWIFLMTSFAAAVFSFYTFMKFGRPGERENNPYNFKFENTAQLVTEGIYKYIRHPMYSSLLFFLLGIFLKDISLCSTLVTIPGVLFTVLTAKTEERENMEYFGTPYSEYMKKTKMFVPFLL